MKVSDIIRLLDLTLVAGRNFTDNQYIEFAFASDLMSDVLTLEKSGILLITGLSNLQAIRTAEMSDINVIIIARNKKCSKEMIWLAEENETVLMESEHSVYRISGELYKHGIKPVY